MKPILLSLALLMVGCGESSQPSEGVDMTDTAPKKDDIETPVDYVDYYKLKERNGVKYLPNEETPFTGRAEGFYENGQKKREVNYKDGKRVGLLTGWHDNGQKKMEGSYKDGRSDGLQTFWYKNGQKKKEENYKDGKAYGLMTVWYENGQKMFEGKYKDDKLMSAVAWKPNGEKCPFTNLKEGNGVAVMYEEDGTEFRQTYNDGWPVSN